MELLHLRYFCTVARLENISRAAREHHIPQPAMSRTISQLEKELGVSLFDRTSNRLSLTEDGRQFYTYVTKGLLAIDDAVQCIQKKEASATTDIRLLLNTNRDIILRFISNFIKRNPEANFLIDHTNSSPSKGTSGQNLNHHLCISALPVRSEFNRSIPLLKERLMIAVYHEHPFASRDSIALQELAHERFVLLSSSFRMHTFFLDYCRANGLELQISMYCADPSYVRYVVDLGLGISLMPERSWQSLIPSNTVLVPLQEDNLYQTHRILWDSSRYMPPLVKKFRDELVCHYRQMFGSMQ